MRTATEQIRRIHSILLQLIEDEPHALPYSDGELAQRLATELGNGQQVTANRVWYYRRDFGIPNSRTRKTLYKNEENTNAKEK